MTKVNPEEIDVIELTQEESRALTRKALEDLGVAADELLEMGRVGRFPSERLRRAWFALDGQLADLNAEGTGA